MRICFLLDENIPFAFIEFLENKGHSVFHLKKINLQGIKNGEVYQYAEEKKLWIVTRDSDFQNLSRYYTHQIPGIILFKLSNSKTKYLIDAMEKLLNKYMDRFSKKCLIIIEDSEIKVY